MTPTLERALEAYLASTNRIAKRLAISVDRVAPLFPLDAQAVTALSAADEERLDAFLYRFSSLAASVQDQVGRALLLAEEEDLSSASRKDQRLLLERLGALDEKLKFGEGAELRNRISHAYPDQPNRQAEIMNLVMEKAGDLIAAYNGLLAYAAAKHHIGAGIPAVTFQAIKTR